MKKLLFILLITVISFQMSFSQETRSADKANGLQVGAKAPDFNAVDADSISFQLYKALDENPVVIIFYRGFWCPYCNKHLAQIQDSLSLITESGAKVVAISPEKPEYLDKMAKKTGANFKLLYDEGYKISDAYDVTFTPKKAKLIIYNAALGANLKETHSDDSQRLPIPATYIIDKNGVIVWRQFNPNYKKRSTVKEIIENLP